MDTASNVECLLKENGVPYKVRQQNAERIRRRERRTLAHEGVLKTQLLIDGPHHALAVIPKGRRLDLLALNRQFRRSFRVGAPDDALRLYPRLPSTALLPAVLNDGTEIFLDESLLGLETIVIETPDYSKLVRIEGDALPELFNGAWCGHISRAN